MKRIRLRMIGWVCLWFAVSCAGGHIVGSGGTGDEGASQTSPSGGGIAQGLYYSFDEAAGNTAATGTLYGAPLWVTGKMQTALHFDGSSQWVQQAEAAVDTSHSFTLTAWAQLERTDKQADLVVIAGQHVPSVQWGTAPAGDTASSAVLQLTVHAQDAAAAQPVTMTASVTLVANTWYHLAASYDAATGVGLLFVDGMPAGNATLGRIFASQGPTYVAGAAQGVHDWTGRLDELAITEGVQDPNAIRAAHAAGAAITPIRPPATPLIVRSPYLSVWQSADTLNGTWPSFWTGTIKALTGMLRVDGQAYVVMGAPNLSSGPKQATQTQLEVTPTQSRYAFSAGGVGLYLNFISPVEPNDLRQQSIPASVIEVQAASLDGQAHSIQWYTDITAEWISGSTSTQASWSHTSIAAGDTQLSAFTIMPASPQVLSEQNDAAEWGTMVWASDAQPAMQFQAGQDVVVRNNFVNNLALNNTVDPNMPRAINNAWPTFAFVQDWGTHVTGATPVKRFVIGHIRTPAVSYLSNNVAPLWTQYWPSWQSMLADFYQDAASGTMRLRTALTDQSIMAKGIAAGGPHYAALLALAFRQAFGAAELVGATDDPWLVLKEISSDGNLSTVDVMYPMFPVLANTNPELLRYLLAPVLHYTESGSWPETFCVHDLGSSYPNATGHNDGGGENMPVEESANMLLMTAAYWHKSTQSDATAFVAGHYAQLKQWADYLVANTLDPGFQNQTDDFTGFIAHSSNLALKGILALGAMAQLSDATQHAADANHYASVAQDYIGQWYTQSIDPSGEHLKLAYDQNDTWSLKYNAFADRLLGLGLVQSHVYALEDSWYASQKQTFGIPLDNRHSYSKNDWELFTAASSASPTLRQDLIDAIYAFAQQTPDRVPVTDHYETQTAARDQFQARPVVGGWFALVDLVSFRP